jgi:phosphatidylserine/phosphatidylglycerophosphate/cardiolipin synthase-like enzyme
MIANRRFLGLVFVALAVLWPNPVDAQIRIEISPDRLARESTGGSRIAVFLDVSTTPAPPPGRPVPGEPGDPFFTISVSRGFLNPDPDFPLPTPHPSRPQDDDTFVLVRPSDGTPRTRGEVHYIYLPPDPWVGGPVTITVEGGQGIPLLGVRPLNLPTFRGTRQLTLLADGGGAVTAPPGRSPFSPTADSVNPLPEMIDRLGPLVLLLGPLALTNWAVNRKGRVAKPKPSPVAAPPVIKATTEKKKRDEDVPAEGTCRLVVHHRSQRGDEGPYFGDEKDVIHFEVTAIPSPGWTAEFNRLHWQATFRDHGRFVPDATGTFRQDFDSSGYTAISIDVDPPTFPKVGFVESASIVPDDGDLGRSHRALRLPWEWRDVAVEFTVNASVKLKRKKDNVEKTPSVSATCVVGVTGANPEIIVAAHPNVVNATGANPASPDSKSAADRAELRVTTLRLFGKGAQTTRVRIDGARVLDPNLLSEPGAPGTSEPPPTSVKWEAGPWWSHFIRDGDKTFWVPPFLVQEPGYGELYELEVGCELERSEGQMVRMPPAVCDVTLLGCQIETRPEGKAYGDPMQQGEYFTPIPGESLFASGTLKAGTKKVASPFVGPAVRHPGARITCQVRDLSQGERMNRLNFCRIPPRHSMDVDAPAGAAPLDAGNPLEVRKATDAIVASAPVLSPPPAVSVENDGRLVTPGSTSIELWKYTRDPARDPIDNGVVVYTLIIEDGLGGKLEVRGALYALLGNLVMETGGPDFRIYEHRPYRFGVTYQHPLGYFPNQDGDLIWEFAFTDRDGHPVDSATPKAGSRRNPGVPDSAVVTTALVDSTHTAHAVVVGHMLADRDIYIFEGAKKPDGPQPGDMRSVGRGTPLAPMPGWQLVSPAEREHSTEVRAAWHRVWKELNSEQRRKVEVEEPGLDWLDHAPLDFNPWTDTTLLMSVRAELRTKDGHLVATSDRNAPAGLAGAGGRTGYAGRTPPEFVWRDHQFRYVLAALRLRLADHLGQPYDATRSRVAVPGSGVEAATARHNGRDIRSYGLIEHIVGPDVGNPVLTVGEDGRPDACSITVRLGEIEGGVVESVSDAKARLNNLGFFAGAPIDTDSGEAFQMGLRRFQEAYRGRSALRTPAGAGPKLSVTGNFDDATRTTLRQLDLKFESHVSDARAKAPLPAPGPRADWPAPIGRTDPIAEYRCPYPPKSLCVQREVWVSLHYPTTIRIPHDRAVEYPPWFTTTPFPGSFSGPHNSPAPPRSRNDVSYLINGRIAFKEMHDAIVSARDPKQDFIYLIGYVLQDLELLPGDPKTKIISGLLRDAAARGIEIRVLLWKLKFGDPLNDYLSSTLGIPLTSDQFRQNHPWGLPGNLRAVETINALAGPAAALVDNRTLDFGTHHQKILIVNRKEGLVAFCGGIDITGDRVDGTIHDLQCRIDGPGAEELLRIFVERWNDHGSDRENIAQIKREHVELDLGIPARKAELAEAQSLINRASFQRGTTEVAGLQWLKSVAARCDALTTQIQELTAQAEKRLQPPVTPALLGESCTASADKGRQFVQVGRTYGNYGLISGYSFAPRGEQTALQMILHAISQAERFIYIEDQYGTGSPLLAEALKAALNRIQHLTILLTHDAVTEQGKHMETMLRDWMPMTGLRILARDTRLVSNQAPHRRQRFIKSIQLGNDRVHVFTLKRQLTENYVHSKLYIVDDELAIIGSANCCRRSFTHDSEVMAAIADQPVDAVCRYNFAHRLRIALWAKHLYGVIPGKETKDADVIYAGLADGVASAADWQHLGQSARVEPYDDSAPVDASGLSDTWDTFVDPDGSLPFTDPRTSSAGDR